MAIPALFFEINALVIALMIGVFFLHEATALWDVRYAVSFLPLPRSQQDLTSMRCGGASKHGATAHEGDEGVQRKGRSIILTSTHTKPCNFSPLGGKWPAIVGWARSNGQWLTCRPWTCFADLHPACWSGPTRGCRSSLHPLHCRQRHRHRPWCSHCLGPFVLPEAVRPGGVHASR